MSSEIPDVPKSPKRGGRGLLSGMSWVWLVPIGAFLTALWVAVQAYNEQGPVIRIVFDDAAGVLPDETELRFRNVPVGVVEGVSFNADLSQVQVEVRIDSKVAPFVDDESTFWIVRPEVTTSGVTGLETVLSGVYIEGTWDSQPGGLAYSHEALERPPLITAYRKGKLIELRSTGATGLAANTPILFKGVTVGRMGEATISQDGQSVTTEAIIYEPHDRLVTSETRFWDTSGFSFTVGASGASLDFSSLASLISGGVTFGTIVSGGVPVEDGAVFDVYYDEATARNSVFEGSSGQIVAFTVIFDDNVSGLAEEAEVEWRGVRVGRVANVSGTVNEERFGDARVRLLATIEIDTSRLGLAEDLNREQAIDFLDDRVAEGMRARLVTASLLAGGLQVELTTDPEAVPAEIDRSGDPFPIFPTTANDVTDVTVTAEGVLQRINSLPVEELLDSAIRFLDSATVLVASDEIRETPAEILGLLNDARGVIGSDQVQALPGELGNMMRDLQDASGDLRGLLAELREAQAVDRLLAAVDQAGAAAAQAEAALAGIPELTDRISTFVAGATELPLERLVTEATDFAADARTLVSSERMQSLPASVSAAFEELTAVLSALTEAETPERISTALADASAAANAVEAAVADVPSVVARLDRIAAGAEEVRLDQLATELEGVLASARELFGDASEAQLPSALSGALREAEAAIAELRAGGLIGNANATMASARDAARAVEAAARDLPGLAQRLNATLAQAQGTLAGYGEGSDFSRETLRTLREIEQAAEAVSDLARAIERNPNSLLLGR